MQTKSYAVDELIHIPEQLLAVREVLAGTFDKEIARIKQEREALAAQKGVAATSEEADKLKAAAESDRTEAAKVLSKANEDAADIMGWVKREKEALLESARELEAGRGKLGADRATLDARALTVAEREKTADARAKDLDERAAALFQQVSEHKANVEAFNKRLDALKI